MHSGVDGFDAFRVTEGYVSGSGTRDGAGYQQTFFGPGCRPYNGWVFFPDSFLRELRPGALGSGVFPVHGDKYEQNGEPYPGHCGPDTRFNTTAHHLVIRAGLRFRRDRRRAGKTHRRDRFDAWVPIERRSSSTHHYGAVLLH